MEEYNSGSEALCQKLKEKADGKIEVPMLDELNKVTLDVIAKVPECLHAWGWGRRYFFNKYWESEMDHMDINITDS